MSTKTRSLLLAASLIAAPLGVALAQTNPTGNLGSNKSSTAAPRTADSTKASGLNTADPGLHHPTTGTYGAAANPHKPGATGRTVVPGSNSTQAGASSATTQQKTGVVGKQ